MLGDAWMRTWSTISIHVVNPTAKLKDPETKLNYSRIRKGNKGELNKVNFDDILSYQDLHFMMLIYMLLPTWVTAQKPAKEGPST